MILIFPQKIEKIHLSDRTIKAIRISSDWLPNSIVDPNSVEFWHDPDMGPNRKFDWSGAHSALVSPPTIFLGTDVCYNTEGLFGISVIVHELTHCSQRERYGIFGWLFMKVLCRFLIERWAKQNEDWVTNNLDGNLEMIK